MTDKQPPHPTLGEHLRDYPFDTSAMNIYLAIGLASVTLWSVAIIGSLSTGEYLATLIFVILLLLGVVLGGYGTWTRRRVARGPSVRVYREGMVVNARRGAVDLAYAEIDPEKMRFARFIGPAMVLQTTDGSAITIDLPRNMPDLTTHLDAQIYRLNALQHYADDPSGTLVRFAMLDGSGVIAVDAQGITLADGRRLAFADIESAVPHDEALLIRTTTGGETVLPHMLVDSLHVLESIIIDRAICLQIVPRMVKQIEAGETVAFSEVSVSKQGLQRDAEQHTWDDLRADDQDLFDMKLPMIRAQSHHPDFIVFTWLVTYLVDRASFDRRIRVLDFLDAPQG